MSLSDEELATLAEKLATMVAGSTNKEEPKKEEKPKETKAEPQSEKSIAEQVAEIMEQKTQQANNQVFDTMWKNQLDSMISQTRGLDEFLNSEDDYGVVRMERLKDMPYEERVATAQKLADQYRKAVSNGTAKAPSVNPKTQELAESNEKKYNEVEEKLKKNEYSSIDELQADFFDALSNEMDSVIGN